MRLSTLLSLIRRIWVASSAGSLTRRNGTNSGSTSQAEDLVDVVNVFCIQNAEANMLDPAGGSGSFAVRGYHRKGWLPQYQRYKQAGVSHQDCPRQIHAVNISLSAGTSALSTLPPATSETRKATHASGAKSSESIAFRGGTQIDRWGSSG
jgi:hypothetical protein